MTKNKNKIMYYLNFTVFFHRCWLDFSYTMKITEYKTFLYDMEILKNITILRAIIRKYF